MNALTPSIPDTLTHVLRRLNEVMLRLDGETRAIEDPNRLLAEALDSMAIVEFLAVLAEDYGVTAASVEECVGRRLGTVAEFAARLDAAGWVPQGQREVAGSPTPASLPAAAVPPRTCWLAATTARLPNAVQSAASINEALRRPAGWLERHAGIKQRRIWAQQDPLAAAAEAGAACLERARWHAEEVGALLVTSEAPPLLTGLAPVLHHRLALGPGTLALDIGGACTGFLAAVRIAQALLHQVGSVLVIAVEAATRYLHVVPGPIRENAALFGDGAAACLLCAEARSKGAVPVAPAVLGVDGSRAGLLQVELSNGTVQFRMKRTELASRAVDAMARCVQDMAGRHALELSEVAAIVAHGGNGRLPGLLARKLGLPRERVWGETAWTGNLGSASLPVAWAARSSEAPGPAIWTAVGAGLMWGAALVGQ